MSSCLECEGFETSLSRLKEMVQCVDCHGFFCKQHIQEKENIGMICYACEIEVTNSDFRRREQNIHPQYSQNPL